MIIFMLFSGPLKQMISNILYPVLLVNVLVMQGILVDTNPWIHETNPRVHNSLI
jgi:hypothetical protein